MRPHAHVTWAEIQRVLLYCDRLLAKLNIAHWRVRVLVEIAEDGAHATIRPQDGKAFAGLALAEDWEAKNVNDKRAILLHEMLHLLQGHQDAALMTILRRSDLSKRQRKQIIDTYRLEEEYIVDHLATMLTNLDGWLPMWPTETMAARRNPSNDEH